MWYGKVAVILYIFSFGAMFSTYYLNQVFQDPLLTNSVTVTSLNKLIGTFAFTQNVNTNLIFGDFISVFQLLGGLMTGTAIIPSPYTVVFGDTGIIHQSGSGFADASLSLLMGGIFDSATLFLLFYIVANRSI